ncbi:HNH endonuclease signature motif containing protein [Mesorhizobium abyssinicae]|uniref:HNH endonuclease signature motif containing protein n=1 Tax=Mesorhizobium abyssinicae TaxID=1209958 RepID=A0ABU5AS00_9HYPH|nr:HNH endonuclease signature motif containing protein [Mesorhizobium abyssinicae]MDX8540087.1 HNH endonuclease signature motif containing protein [Mesorhizobium abyssinicae]
MATIEWTTDELAAAVEAYLQMRELEHRGEKYNKAAIQRMLVAGPIASRTSTEHRMQNISHVLSLMGLPWIEGYKPLPNVGSRTVEALQSIIRTYMAADAAPLPMYPPVAAETSRKLPPTGYWMFVCNRKVWDGEAWLRAPEDTLLYKVSDHNHAEVQAGDLGVLRINARRGNRAAAPVPASVYAVVEVLDAPRLQSDASGSHYSDKSDAEAVTWRAPLKLLGNLVEKPVAVDDLPDDGEFVHFRMPLMTSTIPISRRAFSEVYHRAGLTRPNLTDEQKAATPAGIKMLELEASKADPIRRSRISKYIERGPIGRKVKEIRGCRCQICEALGFEPIAFHRKNGMPFAEAHHVQPVSLLMPGTLGASNVMVLCPNHHRQAHLGNFEVLEDGRHHWRISIDGRVLPLSKTVL